MAISYELSVAIRDKAEAKLHLEHVGMFNTSGLSDEERIKLDVAYAKAQIEYERAARKYSELIMAEAAKG